MKPCRCLLSAAGEKELAENIAEYINNLDENIRTDEADYRRRLSICEGCNSLHSGTCAKCGCYVEMRAAIKNNSCPSEERLW